METITTDDARLTQENLSALGKRLDDTVDKAHALSGAIVIHDLLRERDQLQAEVRHWRRVAGCPLEDAEANALPEKAP